ncbi:MAG: hypothetical protein ThorAB25_07450 [Candidatus Thorarchaeota archaeon AB_25]|nr:MAG: hypothetical protein ThorAB25_07450 [Candidatus Thorarchaeota archaeon AB_25]
MNRRVVAMVLAFIVVGAGTVLLLLPRSDTHHGLIRGLPEGSYTSVSFHLKDIQDCSLNVSFVNDPELLYSLDVQLYESSPAASAFDLSVSGEDSALLQVQFDGKVRIKEIRLVLGSGIPYGIGVLGTNVNATFIYENNAVGSLASLAYLATGSFVNLQFTEDMVFSNDGMEITVGAGSQDRPDNLYLSLDLPDGVNGIGSFSKPLSIHSNTGWTLDFEMPSSITYTTENHDQQPRIGLTLRAVYSVHVWLSD